MLVHNAGCFGLDKVKNWASKTGTTFGHSFTRHGKKAYQSLIGRLETGKPQGYWLNDAAGSQHLESLKEAIAGLKPGEAKTFDLPAGVGEVLTKNSTGEIIRTEATKVTVVRGSEKSNSFIKTAFPSN